MKIETAGIFYDGQSSVPQVTTVFLNIQKGSLSFESECGIQKEWSIKEVVFEMLDNGLQMQYQSTTGIEILKTSDASFIESITVFRKVNGYESWYEQIINKGIITHLLLAIIILAVIGLTYFYAIPWVGEKSVAIIPETYDTKLGGTFVQDNLLNLDVRTDKTKALNAFAKELVLNNTKPLKFIFVNENIVNAFALPDGTIVVYSGIVDKMENYDELVALLGHEAAHVNNRHAMKMLCRNLSGYIFISAILGDANGVMAVIGDNVNSLQSLSFSRKFEQEADVEGFKIVLKNKVNPKGMLALFSRLKSKDGLSVPEFLSSHPVTEQRIEYIQKLSSAIRYTGNNNKKLTTLFEELKQ